MISIGMHVDEYALAREVRMARRVHKGSFLLLEGETDIRRFSRFVDDKRCMIINCYGRRKAIGATKMLYEDGFEGVLAVVDADFDRIKGTLEEHEGIIYSDAHDLDLDWMRPSVIRRYLAEVADPSKCEAHGSAVEILDKIMNGLKPISVARLLSATRGIKYSLSQIDAGRCFCNFSVNVDGYIGELSG